MDDLVTIRKYKGSVWHKSKFRGQVVNNGRVKGDFV